VLANSRLQASQKCPSIAATIVIYFLWLETFKLQEEKRQYTYQPLPEQHIRLLKVTSDGQACEAELEKFHMDDLPYFLALSWTWPKVEHKETLSTESFLCNGKHMIIPTSLYNALLCLSARSGPSSFRIWVDAVCIYQDRHRTKYCRILRFEPLFREGGWFCAFSVSQLHSHT
jgi:hypothetical protein